MGKKSGKIQNRLARDLRSWERNLEERAWIVDQRACQVDERARILDQRAADLGDIIELWRQVTTRSEQARIATENN